MITDERMHEMADALASVDGVVGVVLGGSRARGAHTADSDVDLGVYYRSGLDLPRLRRLASQFSQLPTEVTDPGGWGPWVDGGGWLRVDGFAVDWILRDVDRVEAQWLRAQHGEYAFHAQPGHPMGFLDVAYPGELALSRILADRTGRLARFQAEVRNYPAPLARAVVEGMWEATFLLDGARKGAAKGDTTWVTLCIVRAILLAAHAIHARAGRWAVNEKGLVAEADRLDCAPAGFADQANQILSAVGRGPDDLNDALTATKALIDRTRSNTMPGIISGR